MQKHKKKTTNYTLITANIISVCTVITLTGTGIVSVTTVVHVYMALTIICTCTYGNLLSTKSTSWKPKKKLMAITTAKINIHM